MYVMSLKQAENRGCRTHPLVDTSAVVESFFRWLLGRSCRHSVLAEEEKTSTTLEWSKRGGYCSMTQKKF